MKNLSKNLGATGVLDRSSLRAMLKTISEDDHAVIHRLEITEIGNNQYKTITQISRVENPDADSTDNQEGIQTSS